MNADYVDVFGPWLDIAKLSARLGLGLGGVPAADAIVELISGLVGIQSCEASLLQEIENDTKLLRESDLKTAKLMIEEAQRVGSADSRYRSFLEKSVDMLYKARSLAESEKEQGIVEFHLCLVYYALKLSKDAEYWLGQCKASTDTALNSLIADMQRMPGRLAIKLIDDRDGKGASPTRLRTLRPAWHPLAILSNELYGIVQPNSKDPGGEVLQAIRKVQEARLSRLKEYLKFYNAVEVWDSLKRSQESLPPLILNTLSSQETGIRETNKGHDAAIRGFGDIKYEWSRQAQTKIVLTRMTSLRLDA